jgi:hypothetical protein
MPVKYQLWGFMQQRRFVTQSKASLFLSCGTESQRKAKNEGFRTSFCSRSFSAFLLLITKE